VIDFEKQFNAIECIDNSNALVNNACVDSITENSFENFNYIRNMQIRDGKLNKIITLLNNYNSIDNKTKGLLKNFVVKETLLCKFVLTKSGAKYLVCIPKSMRYDILYQYHDLNFSSHLGIKRTLNKLNDKFHWPLMSEFCKHYIKSCELCQFRKLPKTKLNGKMMSIVVSYVFEQIAVDYLKPLPKSNGNEHVIVITDTFSKFAICKPVRRNNTKTADKFIFEHVICAYVRIPAKLLSDCSQSFFGKNCLSFKYTFRYKTDAHKWL
jgi:hypothetical protein